MQAKTKRQARIRRHRRVRKKVEGTSQRPRLAVYRSNRHTYAQLIDDVAGHTLVTASTVDAALSVDRPGTVDAARAVGELVAQRAKAAGIESAVFDRGGFRFHGRVAAVAEAAREAGFDV